MADQAYQIAELGRLLLNLIRPARVVAVDHAAARCRVSDGTFTTAWRPWFEMAGRLRGWTPPTVGEQVLLLSPGGDLAAGFVLRGLYSDARPAPDDQAGHDALMWDDGTVIVHDATTGDTTLTTPGTVTVTAPKVVVESPDVHLGAEGGPPVARIGDHVAVGSGSSAGLWPIVEGSELVRAS